MRVQIAVDGTVADAESLWDWLRHEPELRGRVKVSSGPATEEAMGAPIELVVVLASSASGVATVLARALSRWLIERERQRRADITIKVTGRDGRQVQISGRRVPDSEQLLRAVLEATPDLEDEPVHRKAALDQ
ncbi:effector-associated constant component EACC1 [Sphaerisporangium perillae]|uniref:effector-associated constant component EACC1 n=1 Tax=Sphaerisporangium perillae TaxID=2935860 RepID=UPI00200E6BA2|nr:hypothetical protein [Sphaerisporangium perillae]